MAKVAAKSFAAVPAAPAFQPAYRVGSWVRYSVPGGSIAGRVLAWSPKFGAAPYVNTSASPCVQVGWIPVKTKHGVRVIHFSRLYRSRPAA